LYYGAKLDRAERRVEGQIDLVGREREARRASARAQGGLNDATP
jgi:hypothetical protein